MTDTKVPPVASSITAAAAAPTEATLRFDDPTDRTDARRSADLPLGARGPAGDRGHLHAQPRRPLRRCARGGPEDDVTSGRVPVVTPEDFLEHAVEENVYAGTAMSRRAAYLHGAALPVGLEGQLGAGPGMTTSTGTVTLIARRTT